MERLILEFTAYFWCFYCKTDLLSHFSQNSVKVFLWCFLRTGWNWRWTPVHYITQHAVYGDLRNPLWDSSFILSCLYRILSPKLTQALAQMPDWVTKTAFVPSEIPSPVKTNQTEGLQLRLTQHDLTLPDKQWGWDQTLDFESQCKHARMNMYV